MTNPKEALITCPVLWTSVPEQLQDFFMKIEHLGMFMPDIVEGFRIVSDLVEVYRNDYERVLVYDSRCKRVRYLRTIIDDNKERFMKVEKSLNIFLADQTFPNFFELLKEVKTLKDLKFMDIYNYDLLNHEYNILNELNNANIPFLRIPDEQLRSECQKMANSIPPELFELDNFKKNFDFPNEYAEEFSEVLDLLRRLWHPFFTNNEEIKVNRNWKTLYLKSSNDLYNTKILLNDLCQFNNSKTPTNLFNLLNSALKLAGLIRT
ncbi:hypothetical protein FACS1894113_5150 [Alphaproteobacteria bacterium]|nr:hypothetical protein FACS1894113_5150 [Alphaproteobacteria bacterium]